MRTVQPRLQMKSRMKNLLADKRDGGQAHAPIMATLVRYAPLETDVLVCVDLVVHAGGSCVDTAVSAQDVMPTTRYAQYEISSFLRNV